MRLSLRDNLGPDANKVENNGTLLNFRLFVYYCWSSVLEAQRLEFVSLGLISGAGGHSVPN